MPKCHLHLQVFYFSSGEEMERRWCGRWKHDVGEEMSSNNNNNVTNNCNNKKSIIINRAFIQIINRDSNNQLNPPPLLAQHHRCPSSGSSSLRVRACHRRTAISARSRCASANPIARWTTECSPPACALCNEKSSVDLLRIFSGFSQRNHWLAQSLMRKTNLPECLFFLDQGSRQVNRR